MGSRTLDRPVLTAALLAASLLWPASAPCAPPEFVYGSIPFGKPTEEVMALFEGVQVHQEATPFIESVGDYALDHYFEGGLQRDQNQGTCFLSNVVTKLVVLKPGWEKVESLTLYFEGFEGPNKPRHLFMIKKVLAQPPAAADFTKVFSSLAAGITASAGHEPMVHQGRLQSFGETTHAFYLPALVGVWDQGDTLAFLMVANGPEGPKPPEMLYVSKAGLERYLENCKIMSDAP